MRWIMANLMKDSDERVLFSRSLLSRRHLPNQANVLSRTHLHGATARRGTTSGSACPWQPPGPPTAVAALGELEGRSRPPPWLRSGARHWQSAGHPELNGDLGLAGAAGKRRPARSRRCSNAWKSRPPEQVSWKVVSS